MFFIVYETTNIVNGKKYRGFHKTQNLNDGYLGSGKAFLNAVKKYGKSNFNRIILEFCETFEELLQKERMYVNKEWVADRNNYNLKEGGLGSYGMIPWNKGIKGVQKAWNKGKKTGPMSDEYKIKISNSLKNKNTEQDHHSKGTEPWNKGIKGIQKAWNKGKKDKQLKCPHCGKSTNIGNLKRWHLDNCKLNEKVIHI